MKSVVVAVILHDTREDGTEGFTARLNPTSTPLDVQTLLDVLLRGCTSLLAQYVYQVLTMTDTDVRVDVLAEILPQMLRDEVDKIMSGDSKINIGSHDA